MTPCSGLHDPTPPISTPARRRTTPLPRSTILGLNSAAVSAKAIVWLSGEEKYVSLARRYVIVHGLRMRFTTFWGDLIVCLLLCVAFLIMWRLHGLIEQGML